MIAYKGFDENLKCGDIQYEIGREYKRSRVREKFLFCYINPLDVLSSHPPVNATGKLNRYCIVEITGNYRYDSNDWDSKIIPNKIKIIKEITLNELIEEDGCDEKPVCHLKQNTSRNGSVSASTEHNALALSEDFDSVAASVGEYSVSVTDDIHSVAAVTNKGSFAKTEDSFSAAICMSYDSYAETNGGGSIAISMGDGSIANGKGRKSIALSGGLWSSACTNDGVAIATGYQSCAKGGLGSWLILTERNINGEIVGMKAVEVDGKFIRANAYYTLKDGQAVRYK